MRVLLFADQCNPDFSSEPVVAYNTCRSIVDHVEEATVVTQIRNRTAIEKTGMGKANVIYLDTEYIARPLWKLSSFLKLGTANSTLLNYPREIAFERELWKRLKADLLNGSFDIVHRVSPISPAIPSPLASWAPVPFVLGPINGGLPYPKQFSGVLRTETEWLRYVRGGYLWLPYAKSTLEKSAGILAGFKHTIEHLPRGHAHKVFDFPENGADPNRFSGLELRRWEGRLTFLFAGRLVPFKCADVAISAFAGSDLLRRHRLLIVGDGPEREKLEALASAHRLSDCIEFCGWRPQIEVAKIMKTSHVFAFPSIRDSGAGVVVEAMMAGLANIVINYGPTQHLVTDECGVKVPLGTRTDHIRDFRNAMERLAENPDHCRRMGEAANRRAMDHLSWDVRARKIVEIYRWVLGERPDKPSGLLPE